MQDQKKFLNALLCIKGVGNTTLKKLKREYGAWERAWHASNGELLRSGLQTGIASAIIAQKPDLHPEAEFEKLHKKNVWILTEDDAEYPPLLREIPNAPVALYGQGNKKFPAISIGVVGTRRYTSYGARVTETISQDLARAGIAVISGLASGIDTIAHRATLEAHGHTIAVLGSGLDKELLFPPENRGIAARIIAEGGTIMSEYPLGTPPLKQHFPMRNRIISGIAKGIVVVEARERSGALITARFALEQNREVFCVPGSILTPTSRGPNMLIREGAICISSAADILDELGIDYTNKKPQSAQGSTEHEELVLSLLETPHTIDELKQKMPLSGGDIISLVSMLELKGFIHGFIHDIGQETYQRID